jgi:hypothetical protein
MPESELTESAKTAVRAYLLKLVTLPSAFATVIAFVIGFLLNDVARSSAYNKAYQEAATSLLTLTSQAAQSATLASQAKAKVDSLVGDVEKAVSEADTLREKLKTAAAFNASEDAVKKVIESLQERPDFADRVVLSFGERMKAVEQQLSRAQGEGGACDWQPIGYAKTHAEDTSSWCSSGTYLRQLDFDGCPVGTNCPIVAKALCCRAF